ncbi:hypothetical protein [Allokutzneria albata]|uniref:hypothetical protein n=1 Tax=Allokutzneria albata TaxID=211114 RepID=UPI0004C33682|nr:hypothetical protein [Allokutzneria albata]
MVLVLALGDHFLNGDRLLGTTGLGYVVCAGAAAIATAAWCGWSSTCAPPRVQSAVAQHRDMSPPTSDGS